jgi:hypothetical protein
LENLIVLGDINVPANWDNFPHTNVPVCYQQLLNCFVHSGLTQLVSSPTRVNNILDLVFANPICVSNCSTSDMSLSERSHCSDHNVIMFNINYHSSAQPSQSSYKNQTIINHTLATQLFEEWSADESLDSESFYRSFIFMFEQIFERCLPLVSNAKKAFYSKKCENLYFCSLRLNKKLLNNPNCVHTKAALAFVENLLIKHKNLIDEKFEQKSLKDQNSKTFWKYISKMTKSDGNVCPSLDHLGNNINDSKRAAAAFSEFFVSVMNNTVFESVDLAKCIDFRKPQIPYQANIPDLTPEAVFTYINMLSNKKSLGINNVSLYILKRLGKLLSGPLSILFNKILQSAEIPSDWKISYIKPIPKVSQPSSVGDFRPISITCADGKLFEYILKDLLLEHLHTNNLMPPLQFGFVPNRATTGNLLYGLNLIYRNLSHGIPTDVFYLDFKKAFDKVPHALLIEKLKFYNFHESIVNCIRNWLQNRIQIVQFNGHNSHPSHVLSGVPQGSVLGPILFNIFTIDLLNLLRHGIAVFYADDAKIVCEAKSILDQAKIQLDLSLIDDWCKRNGMELNLKKSVVMHIGRNNRRFDYLMGNSKFPSTECHRDLGVMVDSNLTFSSHVRQIASDACSRIGVLNRTFPNRNASFHLKLYKVFVLPLLDYCSQAIMLSSKADINMLEGVQHLFSRHPRFYSAPFENRPKYEDRLTSLGLISINSRYRARDVILMLKFLHGKLYLPGIKFKFSDNIRIREFRIWVERIEPPGNHFWFWRTINDYNSLPINLVYNFSLETIAAFLAQLDSKYFL